ncbi:MAG TPA: thioesterase domain-containing protein, partial [Polyangiaceae bacterium]|nr:thioesterase domain-containing protein [Polyangiaceae bacterium]
MTQPTPPTTPASLSQPKQDLLRALIKNRDKASGRHEVSNIVPFKKGAPGGRSLFFFPATDGGVSYFRHVAPYLPDDLAFYGCQAPGFDEECAPLRTVEEIAEYNLRTVRAIQPKGPYYLGGFCMGG